MADEDGAVADITYLFGDLHTGLISYEIPLTSVNLTGVLNDYGELRATFYVDQTGFDNALVKRYTEPGFCFVAVERDNECIWGGIMWARTYQSDGKNVQIYAKSFEAYGSYRLMPNFTRTNIDQLQIFCDLWTTMQSESGSNLGVIVPTPPFNNQTGVPVLQTVTVLQTDYSYYRDIMDQLANGDQGFDWTINWSRQGNQYTQTLVIGQPNLGAPLSPDSLVFDYPGNILNYWETDSVSDSGTNLWMMGVGSGTTTVVETASRPDLLQAGYLRFDVQVQAKTATSAKAVTALAKQQMALVATPINSFTVVQKANLSPGFGEWNLGDACVIEIEDAWHGARQYSAAINGVFVDGTFEQSVAHWLGSGCAGGQSSDFAHSGLYSLELTVSGSPSAADVTAPYIAYQGETYTFTFWLYSTTGLSTVQGVFFWYGGDTLGSLTNFISGVVTGNAVNGGNALPANTWTQFTATATAPGLAKQVRIGPYIPGNPSNGTIFYLDDVNYYPPDRPVFTNTTRITQWSYTPPESSAVEQVQLTFEGIQAEGG